MYYIKSYPNLFRRKRTLHSLPSTLQEPDALYDWHELNIPHVIWSGSAEYVVGCVWVCEREGVIHEWVRERVCECVCVRERVCVCECVCVSVCERVWVCERVCVCEWVSEWVSECDFAYHFTL